MGKWGLKPVLDKLVAPASSWLSAGRLTVDPVANSDAIRLKINDHDTPAPGRSFGRCRIYVGVMGRLTPDPGSSGPGVHGPSRNPDAAV